MSSFKRFLGPGVYFVMGKVGALYIGMAKNIMARISDESHEAFRKAMREAQNIMVVFTKSEAEARSLESQYILTMQPKYNVASKGCQELVFTYLFEEALRERLAGIV